MAASGDSTAPSGPATIATARLSIRALAPGDAALYAALYGDTALMAHVAAPLTAEQAARDFHTALTMNTQAPARRRTWVLTWRDGAHDTGILGLSLRDATATGSAVVDSVPAGAQGLLHGEIGALVLPAWQSRGIAAEAIAALVDHAFAGFPALAALHTRHRDANHAALGLMAKLGFARAAVDAPPPADGCAFRWRLARVDWARRRAGS